MEERTPEIAIEYLEHYKKVKYGMMPEWVWDMAIKALEQEPNITWVTGADGAKIAFWDVPVWKVTKICKILGEPQESEAEE